MNIAFLVTMITLILLFAVLWVKFLLSKHIKKATTITGIVIFFIISIALVFVGVLTFNPKTIIDMSPLYKIAFIKDICHLLGTVVGIYMFIALALLVFFCLLTLVINLTFRKRRLKLVNSKGLVPQDNRPAKVRGKNVASRLEDCDEFDEPRGNEKVERISYNKEIATIERNEPLTYVDEHKSPTNQIADFMALATKIDERVQAIARDTEKMLTITKNLETRLSAVESNVVSKIENMSDSVIANVTTDILSDNNAVKTEIMDKLDINAENTSFVISLVRENITKNNAGANEMKELLSESQKMVNALKEVKPTHIIERVVERSSQEKHIDTATKTEPKVEPKIELKTESKIEPKTEPKIESKIEPNNEVKAEPNIEEDNILAIVAEELSDDLAKESVKLEPKVAGKKGAKKSPAKRKGVAKNKKGGVRATKTPAKPKLNSAVVAEELPNANVEVKPESGNNVHTHRRYSIINKDSAVTAFEEFLKSKDEK